MKRNNCISFEHKFHESHEWSGVPDGVGATSCRPVCRNGVMYRALFGLCNIMISRKDAKSRKYYFEHHS